MFKCYKLFRRLGENVGSADEPQIHMDPTHAERHTDTHAHTQLSIQMNTHAAFLGIQINL